MPQQLLNNKKSPFGDFFCIDILFLTKKSTDLVLFYLEAWVGIEPAYKDLQSSA